MISKVSHLHPLLTEWFHFWDWKNPSKSELLFRWSEPQCRQDLCTIHVGLIVCVKGQNIQIPYKWYKKNKKTASMRILWNLCTFSNLHRPSPLQPPCFLKIAHYWQATAESDEERGRLHEHFLQTTIFPPKHSQMESFILSDQVEQLFFFKTTLRPARF